MKEKSTWEIRKYFELNGNENTMYQHLWAAALSSTWKEICSFHCCTQDEISTVIE